MVFERLDGLYGAISGVLKADGRALNLAFTPEIVGTSVEILNDVVFTKFGSLLMSLVESGALLLTNALAGDRIAGVDKEVLLRVAGHLATRGLKALSPDTMSMYMAEAERLGRSMASFNTNEIKSIIVKPSFELEGTLSGIKTQIENLIARLTGKTVPSPAPAPTPAPAPATTVSTGVRGAIY